MILQKSVYDFIINKRFLWLLLMLKAVVLIDIVVETVIQLF